jgi:hypothetical protein
MPQPNATVSFAKENAIPCPSLNDASGQLCPPFTLAGTILRDAPPWLTVSAVNFAALVDAPAEGACLLLPFDVESILG